MPLPPEASQQHHVPNPGSAVLNIRNQSIENQVSWLIDQMQALQQALHVKANGELVLRKNLRIEPDADITT